MAKEFKQLSFSNLKSESNDRIRVGIAAVHGNVDAWDDRSRPGAFAKTLSENLKRVKHLWNHNSMNPPIASVVEIKEIGAGEIPAEILAKFPAGTITGGLQISREYYDNELANWVLEGIDKGDITEMSYAYDVVKCEFTDEALPTGGTRRIRELVELKLYETSDVLWGMNPATMANLKSFGLEPMPLGTLYQQILMQTEQIKAGRRNSASDLVLIQEMHKSLVTLGAVCDSEESEKSASKSTEEQEAEAVKTDTSLTNEWFELQKRNLQILEI